ncbi:MAG: adenine-specific methyltransferase EcoRI family protein [Gordonia sp. (in: high G+C Gram-positive bacteria)]|uniref:adenine-specific methyltransferase EcoRI family protein n=1 Tax=Gordonia sp. (in: high G+C Gram-positive bacteria) TaxID=84139 RepID=UPI003C77A4A6
MTSTTAPVSHRTGSLNAAKKAKNDEFYTQWADIEREMNAYLDYDPDLFRNKVVLLPCDDPEWSQFAKFFALHFHDFGLRKLIATSFAPDSNPGLSSYQPTLFETESPQFDEAKTRANGKLFVLDRDINGDGIVNIDDLQWEYLAGDGDFRSAEVTALRDESDIVITNPPFSLFREFVNWLVAAGKKYSVVGNSNATTYVEIFPLIQRNELWKGATANNTDMIFGVPKGAPVKEADRLKAEKAGYPSTDDYDFTRLGNSCWFTNIDHGRRHEPLQLMTMDDNVKFSKHKEIRGVGYERYYNFAEAIEVPFVDAIPADYDGIMGVPITFLDKYNPDQFEILAHGDDMEGLRQLGVDTLGEEFVKTYYEQGGTGGNSPGHRRLGLTNPNYRTAYKRIMIRHKAGA